jgi:hypothetical protein
MNTTQGQAARPSPPPPPPDSRTPEQRRADIFEGMAGRRDEALAAHAELHVAFQLETEGTRRANAELAVAVNKYVLGTYALRAEVRPAFDAAVAEYMKIGRAVRDLIEEAVGELLERVCALHGQPDLTLPDGEAVAARREFSEAVDACLREELTAERLLECFYRMVAVHLAADPDAEWDDPGASDEGRGEAAGADRLDAIEA